MRIYLARHGQSRWQIKPDQDWDAALTPLGHEQARRMAHWLAGHHKVDNEARVEIASLCASPHRRAQETVAYAADALQLLVCTQPNLREADFHVADHLPEGEGPLSVPGNHTPSIQYAAFKAQAQAGLEGLVRAAECADGPVLAVTHSALIKTLLRLVVGNDAVCFQLYNTSLNLIEWKRGRWHLIHLNLWDHLPPELRSV
jgi:broad specificity phosphatase PhoE